MLEGVTADRKHAPADPLDWLGNKELE